MQLSRWMLVCVVIQLSTAVFAQERVDADKAKKYATTLTELSAKLTDPPVKVTPSVDKAVAVHADNRGGLVVPDANLSAESLKKIEKEIVPVGIVYLYRVTLVAAEKAIPADKNRTVEVNDGNNTVTVNVVHLAAGRVANRLVLLAYTQGKDPTIVTELTEVSENRPDLIDLEGQGLGNGRASAILTIANTYRAALGVTAQD